MGEKVDADEGIHVVIIGAGLAGLSAALSTKLANPAHRVTVLETVKELQEVGVSSRSLLSFSSFAFPTQGCPLPLTYPPSPSHPHQTQPILTTLSPRPDCK
jgi:phytoene dehydrogenase-like protein